MLANEFGFESALESLPLQIGTIVHLRGIFGRSRGTVLSIDVAQRLEAGDILSASAAIEGILLLELLRESAVTEGHAMAQSAPPGMTPVPFGLEIAWRSRCEMRDIRGREAGHRSRHSRA